MGKNDSITSIYEAIPAVNLPPEFLPAINEFCSQSVGISATDNLISYSQLAENPVEVFGGTRNRYRVLCKLCDGLGRESSQIVDNSPESDRRQALFEGIRGLHRLAGVSPLIPENLFLSYLEDTDEIVQYRLMYFQARSGVLNYFRKVLEQTDVGSTEAFGMYRMLIERLGIEQIYKICDESRGMNTLVPYLVGLNAEVSALIAVSRDNYRGQIKLATYEEDNGGADFFIRKRKGLTAVQVKARNVQTPVVLDSDEIADVLSSAHKPFYFHDRDMHTMRKLLGRRNTTPETRRVKHIPLDERDVMWVYGLRDLRAFPALEL